MREAPEEPARLGERRHVARPAREYGGVREGGGRGRLGRLGDGEQRGARPGECLDAGLPVHRVDEHRRVEPQLRAGTRPRAVPAAGDPARGERHRPPPQHPVPVGDVVPYLRRGEHQRHGRGQACSLAFRDRSGSHSAKWARASCTAPSGAALGLSLRQNGDDQAVIVGDDAGELSVVRAKCQAQPAQMSHPLGLESFREPMAAGPHNSEHDDPPGVVRRCAGHRAEPPGSPVRPHRHPSGWSFIFSLRQGLYAGRNLTKRHIFCTSTVTNPLRGDNPLGAQSASWTTIGMRNHKRPR